MIWAKQMSHSFRSIMLGSIALVLMNSAASAGVLVMGGTYDTSVAAINISTSGQLALPNPDFNYYQPADLTQSIVQPVLLDNEPINVFCVDLLTRILNSDGLTYGDTVVRTDGTVDSLNNTALGNPSFGVPNPYGSSNGLVGGYANGQIAGAIAWLVDNNSSLNMSLDARVALQAAIWKVEYNNDFDVTSFVSTSSSQAAADYQADLLAVGYSHVGADPLSGYSLTALNGNSAIAYWLSPGTFIDNTTGIPIATLGDGGYPVQGFVAAVPLPGSLAIWLCIGTSGLVVSISRRKLVLA